ncbi:MAG: hypothetical protein EXX96DRAFT_39065 [Benjaminiella poitrasii]|nr:MAG: hypothetical protein EXX96DRAFT_39065 [Benjaminiella poitrasii]
MMAEEFPSLQVVKENNLYKFQAPSNNIISPHKPIIQFTDLSVLKTYFDICISTSVNEASDETRLEHESLMAQQKEYFHLKAIPGGVYDTLLQLLQSNHTEMFDKIVNLPKNKPFFEFIKYAMLDFLLNLKRPENYNNNDERSIYCEVFISLFKAFGNCTQSLGYTCLKHRCEKKAKDSDYVWLVSNDFAKEKKNNLKLLDGVGRLIANDTLNYFLIESSGFDGDKVVSHSLNDTLKNIKNGHDNLKFFVSNYRNASFETIKKVHLFSCQIIRNKITLLKYSIKSPTTWKVVECRSASVPLHFSDALEYIKVFELFAFLQNDICEQEKVLRQLKLENLNIVHVNDQDTVAHCLL